MRQHWSLQAQALPLSQRGAYTASLTPQHTVSMQAGSEHEAAGAATAGTLPDRSMQATSAAQAASTVLTPPPEVLMYRLRSLWFSLSRYSMVATS